MTMPNGTDGTVRSRLQEAFRWYRSTWHRPDVDWKTALWIAGTASAVVGVRVAGTFAREAAEAGRPWRELLLGWTLRSAPPMLLLLAGAIWDVGHAADRRPARVVGTLLAWLGLLAALVSTVTRLRDPALGSAQLGGGVALLAAAPIGSKARPWQALAWAAACLGAAAWLALP